MYVLMCLTSNSREKFKYSVHTDIIKQMFMGFAFASISIWINPNFKMPFAQNAVETHIRARGHSPAILISLFLF